MARPNLIIDASIIGFAGDPTDFGDECVDVLRKAERAFILYFDHDGQIESEYLARIREKSRDSFVSRWWVRMIAQVGARMWVSGRVTNADRRELQKAQFDTSDYPYVAVAKNAKYSLLVHEDSDYCKAEAVIVSLTGCRCLHPPVFNKEFGQGVLE